MDGETFTNLADAPLGIQRLREIILQLAVQGKLVPHDSNDVPASTTLEQVQRDLGVGKTKFMPSSDGPFPLPRGWAWATFPALGSFGRGKSRHRPRNDRKLFRDGHFPLVQTGDVARSNGIITTYTGLYNEAGLAQSRVWPKGTMCITIAANIADSGLLDFNACIPDSVVGFIPHSAFDDARFFEYFMRTAKERLEQYAPSTAQKNINLGILEKVQVPLPPLEEIRRIVSRVERLMSLCDDLESRQQRRQQVRVRLNDAALDRLVTASDSAEFEGAWKRVRDNFDLLYAVPENVVKLRHAILQLAVQGKLVPQDPNDEPAERFIERIRLLQQETPPKWRTQTLPDLAPTHDGPWVIPQNWCWVRFAQVANIASALVPPGDFPDLPHIAPNNIEKATGRLLQYRSVREDGVASGKHRFYAGQILFSKIRPNLAKSVLVDFDGLCSADMYPIDCYVHAPYLLVYMLSAPFLQMAVRRDTRVAMPKINKAELNQILVPVPPLPEQETIARSVTAITLICDSLETKLKQQRDHADRLAQAVVSAVVNGKTPDARQLQ